MADLPQDKAVDSTWTLLCQGYLFISGKCRSLNTDIFKTRLLLRPVVCMQGAAAAQLFYDNEKFLRHDAMPGRAQKTLVGEGGVQSLDGPAHQHRKNLFISQLMDQAQIDILAELHRKHWHHTLALWPLLQPMMLFDQTQKLLCQSVCAWAGVPLPDSQLEQRAQEFGRMIDSGARLGWHHWRGRWARQSCEAWLTAEINQARASGQASHASILQTFAWHRDESGHLLPANIAAVELINVLRPTVAIAQLATYSALALHHYPHVRDKLRHHSPPEYLDWFVLEVRRFYPFFPFLAAYTRQDFIWQDWAFKKNTLTLLDIYGTNHDHRCWQYPEQFKPERFKDWTQDDYSFIASGGASYAQHHRCPGEWITNRLMKVIIQILVEDLRYDIPPQDLRLSLSRIPTLPNSRMIIQPLNYRNTSCLKSAMPNKP